jgi:uncharacterized protein (DUF4415 family)
MNKNSISQISDDYDEYPEISQSDLNRAVKRRNFVETSTKLNVNLALDADIVAWFKKKSGDMNYELLINATLKNAISQNLV